MKLCIFINGTNCAGKTSLAKHLISLIGGGIKNTTKMLTSCNNDKICFIGQYHDDRRFGGVDCLNSTRVLAGIVEQALKEHDIVVGEGSYFHTIGLNLTNAIFKADRQMVVFLYAPVEILNERLIERGGKPITPIMVSKQKQCMVAVQKWANMGVPVMTFDTSKNSTEKIATLIKNKIDELCTT
jgi:tRNA uridine 5-carbamoylmethylation protein Kti12